MDETAEQTSLSLTNSEKERLSELEETVERGLETFVEVGRALMEIRDQRLYRADYDTFEAYCRERWGHQVDWAYKQIRASRVVENVSHGIDRPPVDDEDIRTLKPTRPLPTSERVARPLTKLPEDERA